MFLFNLILLDNVLIDQNPFYCPQSTPSYFIEYDFFPSDGVVNYCPQSTPSYFIEYDFFPSDGVVNYCPQTTPDYSFAQAP